MSKLVYSVDINDVQLITAVLWTDKPQPITAYNEPAHHDYSASLLYAVCCDLGIPIVKTYQSKAFCLHVEQFEAERSAQACGVPASYFSKYA